MCKINTINTISLTEMSLKRHLIWYFGLFDVFRKETRYYIATSKLIIVIFCKLVKYIIRTARSQKRDNKNRLPTHDMKDIEKTRQGSFLKSFAHHRRRACSETVG